MFGIIDRNAQDKIVRDAQKLFYRARVHTLILSPDMLESTNSAPLRGLIILRPEQFSDLAGVVARVRAAYPDLPLALFLRKSNSGGNLYIYRRIADFVYDDNAEIERLITDLYDANHARSGASDTHIIGGLYMDRSQLYANLYGLPVPFTQVEWMLLYYLLQVYPRAATIGELATVCFQPGHEIREHNVISRVSQINCKIRDSFPALRLIERQENGTYRLHG